MRRLARKRTSKVLSEANQDRTIERFGIDGSTRALVVRLWRDWLSRYKKLVALAALFMVITAAAGSTYPLLIKFAFDLLDGGGSVDMYPGFVRGVAEFMTGGEGNGVGFYLLPLAIFAVTVVAGGANYLQSVLSNAFTFQTIRDLQDAMFGHLIRADLGKLQKDRSGALISRFLTDVHLMRDALSKALTGMVRDFLKIVFLATVMIYLNWQLTLAIAIFFPIGARPVIRIARRLRRVSGNVQVEAAELTATLEQAFTSARFIKAYSLEDQQHEIARGTFQRVYELLMKMVKGRTRISPITEIFGGLVFGGVLAFAGRQILSGEATIGDFSGFLIALPMIYQPVRSLGSLNAALQEGLAAAARVFNLLDEAPTIVDRPGARDLQSAGGALQGGIRFAGVRFSYIPGAPALKGIDMEVPAGGTVALVGPSGAGKSTILNLVLRFFDVDEGTVTIDGQDVSGVTLASLRRQIALVSQDVTLFNDTVAANIRLGRPDASDEELREAAKAAAAHDFIVGLAQGYETKIGERGMMLSGGERQRLAIAQAMLKDAPILLLDEATSSLDAESEHQVQAALARLAEGRTTIVIAHRLATVMGADRIYVLEDGQIVETGRHDELRAKGGLYERLCKLQFHDELAAVVDPGEDRAGTGG